MKKYVVGVLSFFENNIKLYKVEAENEYEAIKKAMVEFTPEKYREEELEFQNSEDYPKTLEDLKSMLLGSDIVTSAIEINKF